MSCDHCGLAVWQCGLFTLPLSHKGHPSLVVPSHCHTHVLSVSHSLEVVTCACLPSDPLPPCSHLSFGPPNSLHRSKIWNHFANCREYILS